MTTLRFLSLLLVLFSGGRYAMAAEPAEEGDTGFFNWQTGTLGGKQLWVDLWFFHQWRIQRSTVTGHHRLLSPKNVRLAWGSFEECRHKLDQIRKKDNLPPMEGPAVVVLHGLGRSRDSMEGLADRLRQKGGYQVFNMGYATLRGNVEEHAQALDSVIESLKGIDKIHFVGHSLGNVVVRRWLTLDAKRAAVEQRQRRVGRMVMLAPPNQKPAIASQVGAAPLAKSVGGGAFRELGEQWEEIAPDLATPAFEFGIITGGRNNDRGYNPFLEGDDDLIVTVKSTRLPGARDFRVVPVLHTFIMNNEQVQKFVLHFLQHGNFAGEKARQPIGPNG